MIIAIDFDGTISTHDTYPRVPNPEEIREGAWSVLQQLKEEGHILVLWTCRQGKYLTDAVRLCEDNGVEFDAVNDNCMQIYRKYAHLGIGRKVSADWYIDDKGINGLPDTWYEIYDIMMAKNK